MYVRFGNTDLTLNRCGGTALAQCYGQLGDTTADMDSCQVFVNAFGATQALIKGSLFVVVYGWIVWS